MSAVLHARSSVATALVDKGASLVLQDHEGWTALELAMRQKNEGLARTFLAKLKPSGISVTNHGWTVLHVAAAWCPGLLDDLIKIDPADLNRPAEDGTTPLMLAIKAGAGYHTLLQAGADVSPKTKTGWTALLIALRYGANEAVDAVLATGRVQGTDLTADGWGPISLAARYRPERLEAVLALVPKARLAEALNHPTSSGLAAVQLARMAGNGNAVQFLLKAGATPEKATTLP